MHVRESDSDWVAESAGGDADRARDFRFGYIDGAASFLGGGGDAAAALELFCTLDSPPAAVTRFGPSGSRHRDL